MRTAYKSLTTMVAILLAVIVVGCSAGVSDNVADFCGVIDHCTDMMASADTPSAKRDVLSRYDNQLRRYADDATELTDADRQAIVDALTRFVDVMIKTMMADVTSSHPRYADTAKVVADKKKEILDNISATLITSRTLGDFVHACQ